VVAPSSRAHFRESPMIDKMLVIDAVVHPYDLSEENQVPAYRT